MSKNLALQTAAIRHFLPVVEKEDPTGSVAQQYREALHTLEWLSRVQIYLRNGYELKSERPDLAFYLEAFK